MLDNLAEGPPDSRKSSMNDVAGPIQTKGELTHPSVPPVQLQTLTTAHRSLAAPVFQFKSDLEESQAEMAPETEGKLRAAPIQTKPAGQNGLPADLNSKLQGTLNSDFSDVKIHQDAQSATDVGALAYTQGNDVHFAPGQYDPHSSKGQELIGHELTHVVQQRQGRVRPTTQAKGLPVNDDPGLEAEADDRGRAVVQRKVGVPLGNSGKQGVHLSDLRTGVRQHKVGAHVIQRDGATDNSEKVPMKFTYNVPKIQVPGFPVKYGYIEAKEFKIGGEIAVDFSHGDTTVREYFAEHNNSGRIRAGLRNDVELWHGQVCERGNGSAIDIRVRTSDSMTHESGDSSVVLEGDIFGGGALGLRFAAIGMDDGIPEFATLTSSFSLSPTGIGRFYKPEVMRAFEEQIQKKFSLPIRPQIDVKIVGEIKLQPNYYQFAKTAATRLAPLVAGEALIGGALVTGAAFMIYGTVASLNVADDIPRYQLEFARNLGAFANDYNAVMHGQARGGEGGQAAEAAVQRLMKETGFPREIILANCRTNNYFDEAVTRISPELRRITMEKWRKDHWFDTNVNMGFGARRLEASLSALNEATSRFREK